MTEYVDVESVRPMLLDPAWVERAFTGEELVAVTRRRDPVPGLVARLAAKRAVLAVISGQARPPVGAERVAELHAVEVLTGNDGAPSVRIDPGMERPAGPVVIHVSLSHDGGLAAAMVVADAMPVQPSGSAE